VALFTATRRVNGIWQTFMKMTKGGEKGHFLLVYGSQTGQAKAIAEEFQQTAADKGLSPTLYCFSQYEKKVELSSPSSS